MAAILVVTISAMLLGLINIGSTTVFKDIISLALEGLFSSYFIALVLLLWRRIRGDIIDDNDSPDMVQAETMQVEKQLRWGPWRVKGIFGTIINFVGCVYLFIMIFFCFWPATLPVTAINMNHSSLIWGTVVIGSLLYYAVSARKIYKGPITSIPACRKTLRAEKDNRYFDFKYLKLCVHIDISNILSKSCSPATSKHFKTLPTRK
jgi:choline transport protein